ncbi:MAG: acetyl-CoA hydrolase [Actinomycetota bacterium]|nr:acetyl-CoA hydrolase [Actinomycetota bacterium]
MEEHSPLRACLEKIPAGSSILLPPTCGTPVGMEELIAFESERLAGSRVWSGLLLGTYPFTEEPHRHRLRYGTWHLARRLRGLAEAGLIDSYPLRASNVGDFIRRKQIDDVVVVQVAPPDPDGYCSLGVSGSYVYAAARSARMLVAHVNPAMPRVPGRARIKLDHAAVVVTHEQEVRGHLAPPPDEISTQIAARIEPLIADGATLQVGFGVVPEAVLEALRRSGRRDLAIWGMATDAIVTLDEAGMLREGAGPAVRTHDVMGTRRIFDWLHCNERAELVDNSVCTDVAEIAQVPRFVSINSAIEVDLEGNVNSEVVAGRQISGVGGGVDFAEGARRSPGGLCILALPATARGGQTSRIVTRLTGVPHSLPRTTVQYVVTEHGATDLSVLSLEARAEALIALAAPQFRDALCEDHHAARR